MVENRSRLILLVLPLLGTVNGARILGVYPYPSHSHQVVFRSLNMELLKRGHELVVFTTLPVRDPKLKNLTEIDIQFLKEDHIKIANPYKIGELGLWDLLDAAYRYGEIASEKIFSHPDMQRLISPNSTEKFDLIFVEYLYFDSLYALSARFDAPLIGISSFHLMPITHYSIGNPFAIAYSPTVALEYSDDMNLWSRIVNAYYCVRTVYEYLYIALPKHDTVVRKHFGEKMPSAYELSRRISLIFVNERLFFNYPRPNVPALIPIGGMRLTRSKKSLPQDLKKLLDDTNPGFIYFSLGSSVNSSRLSTETKNVLLGAFSELPYTVLWKFETDELTNKSHNVFIQKWFPQDRIVAHPKIMLFMYQGGLQSTEEVLESGVPVIGFPIYSDQVYNLHRLKTFGIAKTMDLTKITKETLKNTILEVVTNSSYKDNAVKLRDLLKDSPYHPMDQAVWWTEHTIRYKGAPHVYNKSRDLMLYQIYLLDILAIFLIACTVFFYCSFVVLRCIFKRYIRSIQRLTSPIELHLKKQK